MLIVELLHEKKILFKLPSGKTPELFINELTTWLEHCDNNSGFQSIALKMFIVLPSLVLQKQSKKSKAKGHCQKVD